MNDITLTCHLQKSFYSARNGSIVPLSITMKNFQENFFEALIIQLIQTVLLNGIKHENEIFTTIFNKNDINLQENQLKTIVELNLPINLPPTHIPNKKCQLNNIPLLIITYEFRITKKIKNITNSKVYLSVPIGIE